MLTFDIALKYLSLIDFKPVNIYTANKLSYDLKNDIMACQRTFLADKTLSIRFNSYYRGMVFSTAMFHCIFKANNITSFWDVALEIIDANKAILSSNCEGFTPGSIYPKVMVDQWLKYCEEVKEKGILLLEGECNLDYFMAAFHYYGQEI